MTNTAHRWNIARAKANLSQLVRDAVQSPQLIENRGREVAVVLSIDDYRALAEEADQGSDAARVGDFLRLSAELRSHGGAEIALPPRATRASPFVRTHERKARRTASR